MRTLPKPSASAQAFFTLYFCCIRDIKTIESTIPNPRFLGLSSRWFPRGGGRRAWRVSPGGTISEPRDILCLELRHAQTGEGGLLIASCFQGLVLLVFRVYTGRRVSLCYGIVDLCQFALAGGSASSRSLFRCFCRGYDSAVAAKENGSNSTTTALQYDRSEKQYSAARCYRLRGASRPKPMLA